MVCLHDIWNPVAADNLYEDVEPVAILEARMNEESRREFRVQWPDAEDSSWVRAAIAIRKKTGDRQNMRTEKEQK